VLSKKDDPASIDKGQPDAGSAHIPAAIGAIMPGTKTTSPDVTKPCAKCGTAHKGDTCPTKKSMGERAALFVKNFFKAEDDTDDVDDVVDFTDASNQLISSMRKSATTAKTDEEFLNEVGAHLSIFNAHVIEKVAEGLDNDVEIVMPDAGASSGEPVITEKGMKTSEKEALLVDLRKKLSDAEAVVPEDQTAASAAAASAVTKKDEATTELSPVAKAEIQKVADENKSLRESITKMQDENASRAALDEAKILVGKSGLNPVEVATLLKNGDEASRSIVKSMVARAVVLAKSAHAFEEIGSSGEDGGANVEFNKKVDEIAKANPKLTKEQAVTKAMEENPDLYDETEYDDDSEGE
jgi:hypothetical protein